MLPEVKFDQEGMTGYLSITGQPLDTLEEQWYNEQQLEQDTQDVATLIWGTFISRQRGELVWTTPEQDLAVQAFDAIVHLYLPHYWKEQSFGEDSETDNADPGPEQPESVRPL